jgi:hypothetical protein
VIAPLVWPPDASLRAAAWLPFFQGTALSAMAEDGMIATTRRAFVTAEAPAQRAVGEVEGPAIGEVVGCEGLSIDSRRFTG